MVLELTIPFYVYWAFVFSAFTFNQILLIVSSIEGSIVGPGSLEANDDTQNLKVAKQ